MSTVRRSFEWVFGEILKYLSFLDYEKNLKIEVSPVGKMYCICALLTNVHTCLYRSMTSDIFELNLQH